MRYRTQDREEVGRKWDRRLHLVRITESKFVQIFTYLGSNITGDGEVKKEVSATLSIVPKCSANSCDVNLSVHCCILWSLPT